MVPEVKVCHVNECFYYRDDECHAHAILVGSDTPICETYMRQSQHTDKQGSAEVGACHVSACMHNDSMFCHACDDIVVDTLAGEAKCMTFRQR